MYVCMCVCVYPSIHRLSISPLSIHSSIRMNASTVCLFVRCTSAFLPSLLPDRHTPHHLYVCVPLAHSRRYVQACSSVCVCVPIKTHPCVLPNVCMRVGCSCVTGLLPACLPAWVQCVLNFRGSPVFACLPVCLSVSLSVYEPACMSAYIPPDMCVWL